MPNVVIQSYRPGNAKPRTTVKVPLRVAKLVVKLFSRKTLAAIREAGVDPDELLALLRSEGVTGTVIEVEKPDERIVVSIR